MSTRGAVWYKREPRAFLEGVRTLTEREIAVYAVVLDLIYDSGHQTLDDPKHIASYFSDLGAAGVRRSIDRLVAAGKLIREDGRLTNKRAKNEGKTREELRETRKNSGHLGGVSSAKSRSKDSKNSDVAEASASHTRALDKIREDIEILEPNGSMSEPAVSDAAKPRASRRKSYPADFEQFWAAYPDTVGQSKVNGAKAWERLSADDRAAALVSLPAYVALLAKRTDRPVKHVQGFLNGRMFETLGPIPQAISREQWGLNLAHARQNRVWSTAEWGPMPGASGCRAPADLLLPTDGMNWKEWKS